ncbi:hypothetical protein [Isoptericola dokdonensis]|uniref:Uncharacterized protein n=1 Tax=Isoptericola dokdonensis DS-3 TaxID=1300344 RepID=A0A161I947_9MICO|nr:hypothetical protein [Isoptericola dokdonensis]ANC32398.1 hypothetical protein I598_2880 [Isoptericola dokdonensis DS-3]
MDRPSPQDALRSTVRIASWFSVISASAAVLHLAATWWAEHTAHPNLLVIEVVLPVARVCSLFVPSLLAIAVGCWVAALFTWRRVWPEARRVGGSRPLS